MLERLKAGCTAERWLGWALLLAFCGFFILPSYRYQANVYYILVMLPFFVFFRSELRWRHINLVSVLAAILVIYMALSSSWTVGEPIRPLWKALSYTVYLWFYFSVLMFLFGGDNRDYWVSNMGKSLLFFGAVIGGIGALYFYTTHAFPSERLQPLISGENLIVTAQVLGFSILMGFNHYLRHGPRWYWLVFILIATLCFLLAQSRGVILGFSLALAVWGVLSRNIKVAFAFFFLAIILSSAYFWGYLDRIFNANSARYEIYQLTLEAIQGNEWFGMGLMTNTNEALKGYGYPHSIFMTTYYFGGVIGVLLLFSLILAALWRSLGQVCKRGECLGFLLLIYSLGIYIFDGGLLVGHFSGEWLLFWFPVIFIACQPSGKINLFKFMFFRGRNAQN